MIIKNRFMDAMKPCGLKSIEEIYNDPDRTKVTIEIPGKIVSINVKPIKTRMKKIPWLDGGMMGPVTKWGLFIQIKADDGYLYDAVWDIDDTADHQMTCTLKSTRKKRKIFYGFNIPTVMNLLCPGCDDLMSLIGTKVHIVVAYKDSNGKEHPRGIRIITSPNAMYNAAPPVYPRYFRYKEI